MSFESSQLFWPISIATILLLVLGAYCLLTTRNLLRTLIGVEILIKAVTLLIILAGYISGNEALSQTFVITLIVIEVVIMVVAGGVVLSIFRHNGTIDSKELRNLKG